MALSEQDKRAQEGALPPARERENTFCRPHRRVEGLGGAGSAAAARVTDSSGGMEKSCENSRRATRVFKMAGLWVLVVRALRALGYASCILGNFREAMAANAQARHIEETLGTSVPEGMLGAGGCGITAAALCDLGEMVASNECQDAASASATASAGMRPLVA